ILISKFEDTSLLNKAVSKGHKIYVPLAVDAPGSWFTKISLSRLDRDRFIAALQGIGIPEDLAEKYSKESARNITILRRQLEFEKNTPEWAKPENVRDIVPALLVGRWDQGNDNDKELIAK